MADAPTDRDRLKRPSAPRDEVEETSEESFPASDPPSWTPQRTGSPTKQGDGDPTPREQDQGTGKQGTGNRQ